MKFAVLIEDSDNRVMTSVAQHIVDDFARLPDPEKREVLADLLRLSRDLDFPEMSDEDLVTSADVLFFQFDRRESDRKPPRSGDISVAQGVSLGKKSDKFE